MGLEVRRYCAENAGNHLCETPGIGKLIESYEADRDKHVNPHPDPHLAAKADRRHSDRFPIQREVRYRVLNKRSGDDAGDGKTINISSSGVLFSSNHLLIPGRKVELSISWPAQLDNKCALKLVARGKVVRFELGRAAIEIQQYEFRTQSSGAAMRPLIQ